jgi:hypothetical protein
MDGTCNAPAKIAGTENYNRSRKRHKGSEFSADLPPFSSLCFCNQHATGDLKHA